MLLYHTNSSSLTTPRGCSAVTCPAAPRSTIGAVVAAWCSVAAWCWAGDSLTGRQPMVTGRGRGAWCRTLRKVPWPGQESPAANSQGQPVARPELARSRYGVSRPGH